MLLENLRMIQVLLSVACHVFSAIRVTKIFKIFEYLINVGCQMEHKISKLFERRITVIG